MAQKKAVGFVILNREGEFLLQLRDDKPTIPYPECWVFPGATVEEGEDPFDAVLREIPEEFEIEVAPEKINFIGGYKRGDGVECFIYACSIDMPRKIREGQCFRFFSLEEIKKLPLGFQQNIFLVPFVERFFSQSLYGQRYI